MSDGSRTRKAYPSDLTDSQWALVEPHLPPARSGSAKGGRPRRTDLREVVDAILYLLRAGCQWDMLPHDLLPKSTVYEYFAQWRDDGTWQRIGDALRERVRTAAGREATPSAACIDSQSVKTTEVGGTERGYDGGKKVKGRKRHLLVDVLGLVIAVVVTSAALDDGAAAPLLLAQVDPADFPRLSVIFGDHKYRNHALDRWLAGERPQWRIEVTSRPAGTVGFAPVRIRWVVERTNAWHGRCRRHSKDYERRPDSAAAMIRLAHIHLMLRRLAPSPTPPPEFRYRTRHAAATA